MNATYGHLEVRDVGDVAVVDLTDRKITELIDTESVGKEVFSLVDDLGKRQVVLDFSRVESISSLFVIHLINLDKRIKALSGKLALCGMSSAIYEFFLIMKLNRRFNIHEDWHTALSLL